MDNQHRSVEPGAEGETLRQHRLEAIKALRADWVRTGEQEFVDMCDRAIAGDEEAYAEACVVVMDTTYGGCSDEERAYFYQECALSDAGDRADRATSEPVL